MRLDPCEGNRRSSLFQPNNFEQNPEKTKAFARGAEPGEPSSPGKSCSKHVQTVLIGFHMGLWTIYGFVWKGVPPSYGNFGVYFCTKMMVQLYGSHRMLGYLIFKQTMIKPYSWQLTSRHSPVTLQSDTVTVHSAPCWKPQLFLRGLVAGQNAAGVAGPVWVPISGHSPYTFVSLT